jgi:hypothetical protein
LLCFSVPKVVGPAQLSSWAPIFAARGPGLFPSPSAQVGWGVIQVLRR